MSGLHLSLPGLIVIALAVARAWRFCAVDDMPWLVSLRKRIVGETEVVVFAIPGKPKQTVTNYRRPTLNHLIQCPWCLGTYLSAGAFALARFSPGVAFWVLGLLAVGEIVGLLVRNLDPTED